MAKKNKPVQQKPVAKKESFLEKTWVNILIMLIFAPAGIYLLWSNKKFDPLVRIIISLLFGGAFIYYNFMYWVLPNLDQPQPTGPDSVQTEQNTGTDSSDKASEKTDIAEGTDQKERPLQDTEPYAAPVLPTADFSTDRLLTVHFLDVGQADSILIETPAGKAVLIDGGNRDDGEFIGNYLENLDIKELSAVVATHPHEDHIGGLETVFNHFSIKRLYMPKTTHTTQTFEDFIQAAENNGAEKLTARIGTSIPIEELDLSMVFLAPNSSSYEKLNNYSAVLKVTYKDMSFLFTGDAEDVSEEEMLLYNRNVYANVLKVGHHGSSTSSTKDFLAKVQPQYAVISLGTDNDYGYPHAETIQRLQELDTEILRTDKLGTIMVETDGSILNMITEKKQ